MNMFLYGGGTGFCLLSNFLLFRIRYVRYLMTLWCIFFMKIDIGFWDFEHEMVTALEHLT